jgi:hypothetical protein
MPLNLRNEKNRCERPKAFQAAGGGSSAYCKDDFNWHLSQSLGEMRDFARIGE